MRSSRIRSRATSAPGTSTTSTPSRFRPDRSSEHWSADYDGVSRPLDPTLAVFFPGNTNTDNTSLADVYNDDGFGSDDDPAGVDRDAFDSSRVIFNAPVAGDYVFRADEFGSSVGPYTLTIGVTPSILEVPTLDYVGFAGFALLLVGASFYLLRRKRAA